MQDITNKIELIENFIRESIEFYYTPIKVVQFIDYDLKDNHFVGLFVGNNKILYSFVINKEDKIPIIQPHLTNND